MKALLSIGGWTYSTHFSSVASTAPGRSLFASTAVMLLKDLGFDGLDIDWEYPADDTDVSNYVQLLEAVRSALDSYAAQSAPGYHFLLTTASPAGPINYRVLHLAEMSKYIDAWHLLSYDYAGSWSAVTGHDANLYPSFSNPNATPFSTEKAVADYIAAGVQPRKIVIGIPLYGRSFEQAPGLGRGFTGVGSGSWQNGVWDYKDLPREGAVEFLDTEAGASYSYDSGTQEFISYDNVAEANIKATFIKNKDLGGAFYWESSSDKNSTGSLITAIAKGLGSLDQSENQLSYPASQYANIKSGMPGE